MSLLARAEARAFTPETAAALRRGGFTLGMASTLGVLLLGTFARGGFQPWLLVFAALAFLPALLLLALSRTLPARRSISVLLVWLLCGFALLLIRVTPGTVAGLQPAWLLVPLAWALMVVELAAVTAAAWFAWYLYLKGAFSPEAAQ